MADFLDTTIPLDRLNKRQKHGDNSLINEKVPLDPEAYYRVTICMPFIDNFMSQIESPVFRT